jgi:NADPH-dependent 2,4-dienoyl-CoA reductase/sulfur reductase-like enzyme
MMKSLIMIVLPALLFVCGAGAFNVKSISNKSRASQLRMSETPYDLAVIGAGPVGAQAAMVAASPPYSKKVVLIDAPRASGMLMNGE